MIPKSGNRFLDKIMREQSVAPVAELVDAPDSKSGDENRAGSSPARGTKFNERGRSGVRQNG
jgi:hypothetical protein